MSFPELGLPESLCTAVARMGYAQPTPVQAASIPLVLAGRDLLARAQTGTGKTAAFGLPMIQRLTAARRGAPSRPRGLVLVPTRELAEQVQRALAGFGAPHRLRVAAIYGGVSMGPQLRALRQGADIVVATAGRLLDHVERRSIDLSAIEILTLDEADRMLDMGFLPSLRRLIPLLPAVHQTLLFSATLSTDVQRLAAEFTTNPARVDVAPDEAVASTVSHVVHHVAQDRKRELLLHVLRQEPRGQALVFCKTKHGTDKLATHLERAGLKVAAIHGNKSQGARSRSLAEFKSGHVAVLAATDVAARGLDIAHLPLVVNFDLPLDPEAYIHRIGRTGRAGLAGRAVSLVSAADRELLRDIQRLLPSPLERVDVVGFDAPAMTTAAQPPRPQQRQPHRAGRARPIPHRRDRFSRPEAPRGMRSRAAR
jgi:ATP-dependent RNA helicase RhlE